MNEASRGMALEALRRLACSAWPGARRLHEVALPDGLPLAWLVLARAADMDLATFARGLAAHAGIEPAPSILRPELAAIDQLPPALLREGPVLPLALADGELSVAIANPADEWLLASLRFATSHRLRLLLAAPDELEMAVQAALARAAGAPGRLRVHGDDGDSADDGDLVGRIRRLLREAVAIRASDVHIQPLLGGGMVRMRVDGMLRRVALLPEDEFRRMCNFFQANGGMDPTNDRVPQDGSLSIDVDGRRYELRLSSLPSRGGERLVIRILDQDREFHLAKNGFSVAEVQALRRLSRNASGLVLLTGPTGSGKTSTLYGLLGELNSASRSVITVENPVEYELPGISQVEVNERSGLTFAAALRSALRQDPNILLVGEIRDEETATTALQAALTGHLVLTTLHTNDALSSVPRLLDLGIRPSVLADALVGIVAQRLCRHLCVSCRLPVTGPLRQEEALFKTVTKVSPGYRAVGCDACRHTGYAGRLPISEIVEVDAALREAIARGTLDAWTARPGGSNTLESLSASAARHIMSGDTSVREAVRVLGRGFWADLARDFGCEIPAEAYALDVGEEASSFAVLIVGDDDPRLDGVEAGLRSAWFGVHRARTSGDARALLKAHDNICHVVLAFGEHLTDAQILEGVRVARVNLAWSRLPAVLLVPGGRAGLAQALVEQGATAHILTQPVAAADVLKSVRTALAKA